MKKLKEKTEEEIDYNSDTKERYKDLVSYLQQAELTQVNYHYLRECIKQCS